jgi:hypothetical protein
VRRLTKSGMSQMLSVCLAMMLTVGLMACGQAQSVGQTNPPVGPGWSWYRDARFPFQLPIPPGWRAGAYVDGFSGNQDCQYVVDLLPPVSHGNAGKGIEEHVPEIITLTIRVACSEWRLPEDDQHYMQEPHPITISGAQATLWDNDGITYIQRAALAHFGGHQYVFYFAYGQTSVTPATNAKHELALYLQVLRGFKYMGK